MDRKTKNLILLVATLVTIGCICFGTFYHVGNMFRSLRNWNGDFRSFIDADMDHVNEEELSGAINQIDIDISLGDLVIEQGSKNFISVQSSSEKILPRYELKNGVLKITQPSNNNFGPTNYSAAVYITLNSDLEKLVITSNLGDVEIDDVSAEKLGVELDLGDLTIKDGQFKTVEITNSLGDIELNKVKFDNANLSDNLGDVDVFLIDDSKEYAMDLSVSLGDIEVDGRQQGESYNTQSATSAKTLEISADLGDITVK